MEAKDLEKAEEQGLVEFFKLSTKINTSNMICFDGEQMIKKYESPEEILEDFYPIRLIYYQKRKVRESVIIIIKGNSKIVVVDRITWPTNCKRGWRR